MQALQMWSSLAGSIAGLYVTGVLGMYQFAFHPKLPKSRVEKQDIEAYPELRDMSHQEVFFDSREENGKRPVSIGATWFASQEKTVNEAVILIPGRGHHRYSTPGFRNVVEALVPEGIGVLVLDPRTVGKSGGKRSTIGLEEKKDVLGAFDYLKNKGIEQISGFGMSQGAHALLLAAAEADVDFKKIWLDSAHQNLDRLLRKDAHGWLGLPEKSNFVIKPFVPTVLALARLRGMDFRKGNMTHAMEKVAQKIEHRNIRLTTREEDHRISASNTIALAKTYITNRFSQLDQRSIEEKIQEVIVTKPGRGHTNFFECLYEANSERAKHMALSFFKDGIRSREPQSKEKE